MWGVRAWRALWLGELLGRGAPENCERVREYGNGLLRTILYLHDIRSERFRRSAFWTTSQQERVLEYSYERR